MRGSFFDYLVALVISFAIGTIAVFVLFHLKIFSGINIFMYRGLVYILLVSILMLEVLLIVAVLSKKLMARDAFNIVVIFACVHITFFMLVPVAIEKSTSTFVLSQLENDFDRKMTGKEISKIFQDKYVSQNKILEREISEQIVKGSIEESEKGTYKLTKKGRGLVNFINTVGDLYGADMRNIK